MNEIRFFQYEPKAADYVLGIQICVYFGLFILSIIKTSFIVTTLFGIIVCGYILARILKGPLRGASLIEMKNDSIKFRSSSFGNISLSILDIDKVQVVGPLKSRRIRIYLKESDYKAVYSDVWKKRFSRAVMFLRKNLPKHIQITEAEPSTWAESVRGDY